MPDLAELPGSAFCAALRLHARFRPRLPYLAMIRPTQSPLSLNSAVLDSQSPVPPTREEAEPRVNWRTAASSHLAVRRRRATDMLAQWGDELALEEVEPVCPEMIEDLLEIADIPRSREL